MENDVGKKGIVDKSALSFDDDDKILGTRGGRYK